MMPKQSNIKRIYSSIEIFILIIIACIMLFLNYYGHQKMNEVEDSIKSSMFINESARYNEQFGNEILKIHDENAMCKKVEVYDPSLQLILSIRYDNNETHESDLSKYPDLVNILKASESGSTIINTEGGEEAISFLWTMNNFNESRLILTYSSRKLIKNMWLFDLGCYLVIILIFFIVIHTRYSSYKQYMNNYMAYSE